VWVTHNLSESYSYRLCAVNSTLLSHQLWGGGSTFTPPSFLTSFGGVVPPSQRLVCRYYGDFYRSSHFVRRAVSAAWCIDSLSLPASTGSV
jgi:hypothetical protein